MHAICSSWFNFENAFVFETIGDFGTTSCWVFTLLIFFCFVLYGFCFKYFRIFQYLKFSKFFLQFFFFLTACSFLRFWSLHIATNVLKYLLPGLSESAIISISKFPVLPEWPWFRNFRIPRPRVSVVITLTSLWCC